jgi:hypothetical protein
MEKAAIENLLMNEVLPHFSDCIVKGRLLYERSRTGILRAIYVDRTSNPASSHIYYFVLPLYVPSEHLSFNFGDRLSQADHGGQGWTLDAGDVGQIQRLIKQISTKKTEFLDKLQTPHEFAEYYSRAGEMPDIHKDEAVAYSWVMCGDKDKALVALAKVLAYDAPYKWIADLQTRAANIHDDLLSGDSDRVRLRLEKWQAESESVLGLW